MSALTKCGVVELTKNACGRHSQVGVSSLIGAVRMRELQPSALSQRSKPERGPYPRAA